LQAVTILCEWHLRAHMLHATGLSNCWLHTSMDFITFAVNNVL